MSEFQNGKLSGVTGTVTCKEGSDTMCHWDYFGANIANYVVGAGSEPDKFAITYHCDDTKYKGWRHEMITFSTRSKDLKDAIPEEKLWGIVESISKVLPEYPVAELTQVLHHD